MVVAGNLDSEVKLDKVPALLKQTFGTPFTVWQEEEGAWKSCDGMDANRLDDDLAVWLNSEIDVLRDGKSVSLAIGEFHSVIAVPVSDDEASVRVAIGEARLDHARLAAAAADSLRSALVHSVEVGQLNETVDEYRRQFSDDLEERNYLRQVACYAENTSITKNVDRVAREILPQLKKLCSFGSLYLVKSVARDDGTIEPVRVIPATDSEPAPVEEALGLIRSFASSKCTRPFVRVAERFPKMLEVAPSAHCFAVTTLLREGEHFGWLIGIDRQIDKNRYADSPLPESDMEIGSIEASLLEATGILLASHIHNQRLFKAREELTTELVRSLIAVLDARDQYTCGHSDRVASMGRELAVAAGLPASECETIYLSGLLHDLGKIGVSDDVLLKPGRLTDEEFAQIKEHPQRGYDMLKRLEPLKEMLPGILHHHEAWDGSGYPHGLAGENIPLIARILAVADTFDAMTSDRPYRSGMPLEKAERILREGAGKQWDSQLIEQFLARLPRMVEICRASRQRMDRILQRSGELTRDPGTPSGGGEIENAVSMRGSALKASRLTN